MLWNFQEFTVLHLQHPVSAGGDFGVVGDDDDAVVFVVGQILENLHNVTAVFRVQIVGGLVGQDQLTAGGQGSGDGHPLLLTAGEHIRKTPELILFQPHLEQPGLCQGIRFLPGRFSDI